jgi:hypothetical protein
MVEMERCADQQPCVEFRRIDSIFFEACSQRAPRRTDR